MIPGRQCTPVDGRRGRAFTATTAPRTRSTAAARSLERDSSASIRLSSLAWHPRPACSRLVPAGRGPKVRGAPGEGGGAAPEARGSEREARAARQFWLVRKIKGQALVHLHLREVARARLDRQAEDLGEELGGGDLVFRWHDGMVQANRHCPPPDPVDPSPGDHSNCRSCDAWPGERFISQQKRPGRPPSFVVRLDRKSTRLNSSHGYISYAVFCLKKKSKGALLRLQHSFLRGKLLHERNPDT